MISINSPLKKVPMLRVPFIGILFLCLSATACSQNSLDYYINAGLQHSPTIRENENLVLKSKLDKQLAAAQYDKPQVNITASYWFTPYFNNGGQFISANPDDKAIGYDAGLTNGGLYSAQFNVTKSLLNDVYIGAYNEQADISVKNAEYANALIKHSLSRDITDAYLTVCQDQLLFQLAHAVADTVSVQLSYLDELVKKGLAKKSDYLLMAIEADNQKLVAEQAWGDYLRDRNALYTICGIQDTVTGTLNIPDITVGEIQGESHFLNRYSLDSSGISNQQRLFETRYAPQLNAFFNTGLNATTVDAIQRKFGLSAGLNFSLPVYDGEQKSVTRQQTEILLKTVSEYKDNQIVQIMNNRKSAAARIETAKKNLDHIASQIRSYEQILRFSNDEVRSGQRSYIDYISVIRTYLELKKNEVAAIIGYRSAINQFNYWNW